MNLSYALLDSLMIKHFPWTPAFLSHLMQHKQIIKRSCIPACFGTELQLPWPRVVMCLMSFSSSSGDHRPLLTFCLPQQRWPILPLQPTLPREFSAPDLYIIYTAPSRTSLSKHILIFIYSCLWSDKTYNIHFLFSIRNGGSQLID